MEQFTTFLDDLLFAGVCTVGGLMWAALAAVVAVALWRELFTKNK